MQKHRLPPVAIALAIVMLTGCKDPVGLPNQARTAATVYYGIVPYQDSATGHIDYFEDPPLGIPMYSRDVPGIKWGDTKNQDGEEYPRTNGFSVFNIPYIPNSEAEIWPCSLYYYLRAQSGDTNFRLVVTELSSDPRIISDVLLFWYAWYADSIAGDVYQGSNGWHAIPLSTAACAAITTLSLPRGGGDYYTGWITPDTADWSASIWGLAWGANSGYSPYIKIVAQP